MKKVANVQEMKKVKKVQYKFDLNKSFQYFDEELHKKKKNQQVIINMLKLFLI